MRNKYPGPCYRCGRTVPAGAGHFERHQGRWRVRHHDYPSASGAITCAMAKADAVPELTAHKGDSR